MRENMTGEAADGARAVPGLGFLHPELCSHTAPSALSAPLGSGTWHCRPGLRKGTMENEWTWLDPGFLLPCTPRQLHQPQILQTLP